MTECFKAQKNRQVKSISMSYLGYCYYDFKI